MRERAYLLWERSDRRHDEAHYWHRAEREIDAELSAEAAAAPKRKHSGPKTAAAKATATKASAKPKSAKKTAKPKDAGAKTKPKPKRKPKESSGDSP